MKKIYATFIFLLFLSYASGQSDYRGSRSQTHRGGNANSRTQHYFENRTNSSFALFTDHFDGANDTTSLKSRGYIPYYRGGGPPGLSATWYQGATVEFPAYSGPDSGYVAGNYNCVTGANDINNWLVLPSLNLGPGDVLSFYSQSILASQNPDSLHIWYSAAGDSTPEGNSWVLLGEFEVNTAGIWQQRSFSVPAASSNGRLAIQYAVIDGGPGGINGNYFGIDELEVNLFTGIEKNDIALAKIFPNPGTGRYSINLNRSLKNARINVFNVQGQNVQSLEFEGQELLLDLSEQENGVYFVRIVTDDYVENHSVVKSK